MKNIKEAITELCEKLTEAAENEKISYHCDFNGKKYYRIIYRFCGNDSAPCFVKIEDGSIWKPKGWKGPTNNFSRGNVFSLPEKINHYFGR